MAISMKKYIDIVSGTAGVSQAARRNMGARCFTTSDKVGYNNVREFTSADAVLEAFGSTSNEYKFASKYFGFVSKSITKATKISYAKWSPNAESAYVLTTASLGSSVVDELREISSGSLKIKVGSETKELSSLDFSQQTRVDTATVSTQGGSLGASVDEDTFAGEVNCVTGTYTFSYDGTDWLYNSQEIDLEDYGITLTRAAINGDKLVVAYSNTKTIVDTGSLGVVVDGDTFGKKVGAGSGEYVFTYNGTTWSYSKDSGSSVAVTDLSEYGITMSGSPISGSTFTVTYENVATPTYEISIGASVTDKTKFAEKVSLVTGSYVFTYNSGWKLGSNSVTLADYGLSVTRTAAANDTFTIVYSNTYEYAVQSISDALNIIQTAMSASTVTYWNSCQITLVSGAIRFLLANGTDEPVNYFESGSVSDNLNLSAGSLPILSDKKLAQTPVEAVKSVVEVNDNFGSFMFLPKNDGTAPDLTKDEIKAVASGNATRNMVYLYSVAVDSSNYVDVDAELGSISDNVVDYYDSTSGWDCEEFMPMVLFAATNYERPNSTKCNMYQQFDDVVTTVETDKLSEALDLKRVNYYGCTQKAGNKISFYQRGYNHDGTDTACFCNEVWMKDAIETECLNLFLAKEKIPANEAGRALVQMIIKGVVDEGIYNGTVMPGATLDNIQKSTINTLANDEDAADAVVTNGYWLGVTVNHKTDDYSNVLYYADYVLIYKKGDAIRKVTGSDVLI